MKKQIQACFNALIREPNQLYDILDKDTAEDGKLAEINELLKKPDKTRLTKAGRLILEQILGYGVLKEFVPTQIQTTTQYIKFIELSLSTKQANKINRQVLIRKVYDNLEVIIPDPVDREVFILFMQFNLSPNQIAKKLSLPVGKVYSCLKRAFAQVIEFVREDKSDDVQ